MTETMTVTGLVATTPRHIVTQDGLPITSFRVASAYKRFDRTNMSWVEGETNWYTITCYNRLAINVAASINKGERIVVSGILRVRDWDNGERSGTSVELEADSLGHDLTWGNASFIRTVLIREENTPDPVTNPEPTPEHEAHSCNCRSCEVRY